jgi:hypothetical protein
MVNGKPLDSSFHRKIGMADQIAVTTQVSNCVVAYIRSLLESFPPLEKFLIQAPDLLR